jgi:hypothetical protein
MWMIIWKFISIWVITTLYLIYLSLHSQHQISTHQILLLNEEIF